MEYCDQFAREVGGDGGLKDRLAVLAKDDVSAEDAAVGREVVERIIQQLLEQSSGLKDQCNRLSEEWLIVSFLPFSTYDAHNLSVNCLQFKRDSEADWSTIVNVCGTFTDPQVVVKTEEELRSFMERADVTEREAQVLARQPNNDSIDGLSSASVISPLHSPVHDSVSGSHRQQGPASRPVAPPGARVPPARRGAAIPPPRPRAV